MLAWLTFQIADGKSYCGKSAALPAAAAAKGAESAVIFDLSEDFNDRRADMCERDRGILIFTNGTQSFDAALGTVGVYRTGASQLLAFRQTGTNLHLINAPAEEFRFPPPTPPPPSLRNSQMRPCRLRLWKSRPCFHTLDEQED